MSPQVQYNPKTPCVSKYSKQRYRISYIVTWQLTDFFEILVQLFYAVQGSIQWIIE